MSKIIRILGAGPSGLAAAINLAKAGYGVEIFERRKDCGDRFLGDLQGLENWTNKEDFLETLRSMNIDVNFDCDAFSTLKLTDGIKTSEDFVFHKPLFYLVKRGNFEGTLDYGLKKQAIELGIKINFNQSINPTEADIVATGTRTREVFATDKGIIFKTTLPDMAIGLVNDKYAFKGYSYLLITKGYGCICTVLFDQFNKTDQCFKETFDAFSKIVDLNITEVKTVGGIGSFALENKFINGPIPSLNIGEAAGLQDLLWGFGIRSAITSGYLAAQSIIHKTDYEKAASLHFYEKQKATIVLRYLYEKFSKRGYRFLINTTKQRKDTILFLYRAHKFTWIHKLIYPFAIKSMRSRYTNLKI